MDIFEFHKQDVIRRCKERDELCPMEETRKFERIKGIRKAEKWCRKRRDNRTWYKKPNREKQNGWKDRKNGNNIHADGVSCHHDT